MPRYYGTELGDKKGHWFCTKCQTWNREYANPTKKVVCPFCSADKPEPKAVEKPQINEGEAGSSAENPIPLWDRIQIMDAIERGFGEDFFVAGESVVRNKAGSERKLIQIKLEDGTRKNLFFGL